MGRVVSDQPDQPLPFLIRILERKAAKSVSVIHLESCIIRCYMFVYHGNQHSVDLQGQLRRSTGELCEYATCDVSSVTCCAESTVDSIDISMVYSVDISMVYSIDISMVYTKLQLEGSLLTA